MLFWPDTINSYSLVNRREFLPAFRPNLLPHFEAPILKCVLQLLPGSGLRGLCITLVLCQDSKRGADNTNIMPCISTCLHGNSHYVSYIKKDTYKKNMYKKQLNSSRKRFYMTSPYPVRQNQSQKREPRCPNHQAHSCLPTGVREHAALNFKKSSAIVSIVGFQVDTGTRHSQSPRGAWGKILLTWEQLLWCQIFNVQEMHFVNSTALSFSLFDQVWFEKLSDREGKPLLFLKYEHLSSGLISFLASPAPMKIYCVSPRLCRHFSHICKQELLIMLHLFQVCNVWKQTILANIPWFQFWTFLILVQLPRCWRNHRSRYAEPEAEAPFL